MSAAKDRRPTRTSAAAALTAVLAVAAGGCGAGPNGAAADGSASAIVLASASLTSAFTALEAEFTDRNPGLDLEISFGSASMLAEQIQNGAPADLFASADTHNMDKVVASGDVVVEPEIFVYNSLQIVVPADDPADVSGLADLAEPGRRIALAGPEVPAGRGARDAFEAAGLTVPEASQEADVKAVLNRVVLGEADAGVVWVTDVLESGNDVVGVDIPEEYNVRSPYVMAVVDTGSADATARAFQEFVLSPEGQEVLTGDGFEPA